MLLFTMHSPPLFFLFSQTSILYLLCHCFTSASGQSGTVGGSWHLSTSQPPSRPSAERLWVLTRGKTATSMLPCLKLNFIS